MGTIGSMLAGHEESPGNVIKIDGKVYKQYWGSASEVQKGGHHNVEGKQLLVPYRGSIKDTLKEMQKTYNHPFLMLVVRTCNLFA